MLVKNITELLGNTPTIEISPEIHGLKNFDIYAKLELFSPWGSIKDKPAWNILKEHIDEIKAQSKTVIDLSSGNMGKAIQTICSIHNIPFKVVTNRIRVREVKQILQLLGAELEEMPGRSECPDPNDPNSPIAFIERALNSEPDKYFPTHQLSNIKNLEAHYKGTGKEIFEDVGIVDYFIGGLGSTGSTRGAGEFLKEKNPTMKVVGVLTAKGDLLPGIRNEEEMYEVGLFQKSFYDDIVTVNQNEAIDCMLTLIRKIGVLSGPTGGGSFAATLNYLRPLDATATQRQKAVFIVCDRVEWYLSYLQKCRPELFSLPPRKDSIKNISQTQLAQAPQLDTNAAEAWLEKDPRPLVVDMRGSIAFKASHIEGSINIPADTLEDLSEWGIPFSHGQKVLFVCPVGDQSRKFAYFYQSKGIDCASLQGGFIAWRDSGKATRRLALAVPVMAN